MIRTLCNILVVLVCASALSACGDNPLPTGPSPAPMPMPMPMPTPEPVPAPTPEPPPTLVSLPGMVQSRAGNPLAGATVTILDGVNIGQTTTTDATGAYRFNGLTKGNGNLSAKVVGYEEARAGVYINGENTLDFVLKPEVIDPNGSWVGSGTGTASDGAPVSVSIEFEVSSREVKNLVVRYKFSAKCNSVFTSRLIIPVVGNSFEQTMVQNNGFTAYIPTVLRGTFSSSTTVAGTITLVKSSLISENVCPATSATVEWSGTKK